MGLVGEKQKNGERKRPPGPSCLLISVPQAISFFVRIYYILSVARRNTIRDRPSFWKKKKNNNKEKKVLVVSSFCLEQLR